MSCRSWGLACLATIFLTLPAFSDLSILLLPKRLWPSCLFPPASCASAGEPRIGGTYRRPLENDPLTLDPAQIADNYGIAVTQQVFDGLVQYDTLLTLAPAIAETWRLSPDGLTWIFHLRKGVKFHHGREVNAEDFVYSLRRLLDPKSRSRAREVLSRAERPNVFPLEQPNTRTTEPPNAFP